MPLCHHDLARSAADAPRMGGLALVASGNEVLRRLDIHNSFEVSSEWLVRLSALHLLIAAFSLACQPQVVQLPDEEETPARAKVVKVAKAVIMEVASKLPIERAERIAKAFERFDEDHNGGISLEELQRLFAKMGLKDKSLQTRAFQALDINGDGDLSFSEFAAGVLRVFTELLEERFLELFRRYDLDSDGMLSRAELEKFVEKVLPLANRSVQQSPEAAISQLFGDQESISFEELRTQLLPGKRLRR
ncbi:Calcium-dependent protein kinase 27 [Durusdinium trenchii]|uniref:Calcium-dependent protein kinase 27 n=1 Tax=Durusdinium trenchii TaxID=1381693 RepID=A0ABP0M2E0_9DINO